MTRGHPPYVAIDEAQRYAAAQGCLVMAVNAQRPVMPFDFVTYHHGRMALVKVRRLRYAGYGVADIAVTCRDEIAALRAMPVSPGVSLQLHVRGPGRHWHWYLVLPDRIESAGSGGPVQGPRRTCRPGHGRLVSGQQTLDWAVL